MLEEPSTWEGSTTDFSVVFAYSGKVTSQSIF